MEGAWLAHQDLPCSPPPPPPLPQEEAQKDKTAVVKNTDCPGTHRRGRGGHPAKPPPRIIWGGCSRPGGLRLKALGALEEEGGSSSPCPPPAEFGEQFKLRINRAHRGLRRVLQARGIRFEVTHKG